MENPETNIIEAPQKERISSKKARNITLVLSFLAVLLLIASVFIGLNTSPEEITTFSMGSYVQQKVYGADRQNTAHEAASAVAALEEMISWRVEGSDIEKLNLGAGGDFIEISPLTYGLLELCNDVSELSGGAFDVTISPLSRLWDFDRGDEFIPEQSLVEELLPHVDYRNILLGENNTAALKQTMTSVDLGGIGKGAACDAAINVYKQSDVSAAIIAVGGSVGVYGGKLFGDPWTVSIKNPAGSGTMGELKITDGFVSTSGSYEKFFTDSGELYHHILDPKTGYPAKSRLVSVTVKSASGALSDALSTACFILGLESAAALLREYDSEAVFIDENNKVYLTDGLKNSGAFKITNNDYTLAENYNE